MEQRNLDVAYRVLLHLYIRGARHFCVAPGSRSAPLVFALQTLHINYPSIQIHSHFDERGMAFFGLGLCKATNSPVVLITTSGTAVANMFPAIIESSQTHIPLIALTADRPDELLDCGANQAIQQKFLFGSYPSHHVLLPAPDTSTTINQIDQLLGSLPQNLPGPVHINCAFREPLYGHSKTPGNDWQTSLPALNDKVHLDSDLPTISTDSHPLIIIGNLPEQDSITALEWATACGYAVTCDLTSGISLSAGSKQSFNADLTLASKSGRSWIDQFSLIIQFGGYLTSKRLQTWLQEQKQDYWLVSPSGVKLDPGHHATHIYAPVQRCVNYWHKTAQTGIATPVKPGLPPIPEWQWSELALASTLAAMPDRDCNLFIGNSLSVRWFNCFSQLSEKHLTVFTNRGASGIDGLIATAAGIAKANTRPVLAVIGDVSALHDLNSLALTNDIQSPLLVIIVNNSGGNIFNLLPAADHPEINSKFFRTDHSWHFEHSASQFNLSYHRPDSLEKLHQIISSQLVIRSGCVIECQFPPGEASSLYLAWQKSVAEQ